MSKFGHRYSYNIISQELWHACVETGTFATVYCCCCCIQTGSDSFGCGVEKKPPPLDNAAFVRRKSPISGSLFYPLCRWKLNHSGKRNGIQAFVRETFTYSKIVDMGLGPRPSGARHRNTLSRIDLTSHISAVKALCAGSSAHYANPSEHSSCRCLTVGVLVEVRHKKNCMNLCLNVLNWRETPLFFCILCFGVFFFF